MTTNGHTNPHTNGTNGHTNGGTNGTSKTLDWTKFGNIIDGQVRQTSETRHSINPSTLEENPEVPVSTQKDIDDAVHAARAAADAWGEVSIADRQKAVLAYADALDAAKDDFAEMLTKEQGKPIFFAKNELDLAVRWIRELAGLEFPEEVIEESADRKVITRYTPLGVALGIVPWNFPVQLAVGKIAPALVAGNTIIIKPSPFTPYCGLKLVELGQPFFPPGVLQALSGGDNLGPLLTAHPGIDKVSFTGSTATGKKVMESCSKTLKRVTLELGGNDPAIVCADVNIKETVPKVASLAFMNSGQVCIAIKRIFVHASIYDAFLAEMVSFTKTILVGDGFAENTFLGPIQNKMQYDRVNTFIEDIEKDSLKVAVGGDRAASKKSGKGYFVNPTIIDNPSDDSRLVVEEPFGPIVPLMKWTSEDEVLDRANNTDMGLGASVWTSDLARGSRMARKLKAGNVWVNSHMELQPNAAFGGHKQSGVGAEWGVQGLKSYCNAQTLYLKK